MERERRTRAEDVLATNESEFVATHEREFGSATRNDLIGMLDRDEDDPFVTPWKSTSVRHILAN